MKTTVAVTYEIDNAEVAAEELYAKVKEAVSPGMNAFGMLYCDIDCDVEELSWRLSSSLGIDVAGSTSMAMFERGERYIEEGIVLAVFTSWDAVFSIGMAEGLRMESYEEKIGHAYRKACSEAMGDPKMILLFAPLIYDLSVENMIEALDIVSGKIPCFGGVASDHLEMAHQKTFLNGKAYDDALIMVLLSGNIQPVFSVQHSFTVPKSARGIITSAKDSVVRKVGDQTFVEFMESFGYPPEDGYVHKQYLGTPLLVNFRGENSDNIPVLRDLGHIHLAQGEGVLMGKVQEDAIISIGMMGKENLSESCRATLENLFAQMKEKEDYAFSVIFVCSCAGRNLLMADDKNLEADITIGKLHAEPERMEQVQCFAFYAFGEICPTSVTEGRAVNRLHNSSFVACAI